MLLKNIFRLFVPSIHYCTCYWGGEGGRSSSASTTNNIDRRVAVQGGVGVSGDGNTVMTVDPEVVARAFDSIDKNNAIGAEGYSKLLDTAKMMFNTSEGLIGKTQSAVADAYAQAQTTKQSTIDNKTIVVLAVAGAVAAIAFRKG